MNKIRFRPGIWFTMLMLPLALVFALLGKWQLEREQQKIRLVEQFQAAPEVSWLEVDQDTPRFSRILGQGKFDSVRHVLLDNRVFNGQPGVHVFTPFKFNDGRQVLVNRGWLPLPPDRQPPGLETPAGPVSLAGRLNPPPRVGRRLGEAQSLNPATWPNLVTYLELSLISEALGMELDSRIILLAAAHPAGFQDRDWSPVNFGPEKNRAYALQWFALALTVIVVYLVVGSQRQQEVSG